MPSPEEVYADVCIRSAPGTGNAIEYVRAVWPGIKIEPWQVEALAEISGPSPRLAVASGHGIGKTAWMAWVVHWHLACTTDSATVVTANTGIQLETKTWNEVRLWHDRALDKDRFVWSPTKLYRVDKPTSFAAPVTWSERTSEGFAGTHAAYVLYLFDEASAIPDEIWETSEGAMTGSNRGQPGRWAAFGNPTRPMGRFRDCWGRFRDRWKTMNVDSRDVSFSDKMQIAEWIEDYGEDSDFVRVRVKGLFPRTSSLQLFGSDVIENCTRYSCGSFSPIVWGVDVARSGNDDSCLVIRTGRAVATPDRWHALDAVQLSGRIAGLYQSVPTPPRAVFVDGGGVGAGVVDILKRTLPLGIVREVQFGGKADNERMYANKRAEMYFRLQAAMTSGLLLPQDKKLLEELSWITQEPDPDRQGRALLTPKKLMPCSPDAADALALTYATEIAPDAAAQIGRVQNNSRQTLQVFHPNPGDDW